MDVQMRGLSVDAPGTYVLIEDVVDVIRAYAQSLDDPNAGAAIHELATWLGQGEPNEPQEQETPEEAVTPAVEEEHDSNVYRVELYAIEEAPNKMRWYARTVDAEGTVLHTTNGSWDYDYVWKDASERWPGVKIQQLNGPHEDSVWLERIEKQAALTSVPLRERPSPKRMFGT